ncbi:septum formation initiator family protein [Terribacillus sp. 7520-G]|uniref:FtsB family cell division protein n=1 Tax=Terribacillus TaxID=459532 RepID=UPI000BA591C6|nr:septum formation initiator family protein [Terribacillus sp. 7520-G]PAD37482.1 cell division protein [Terribacillus sp. 7520-G]
MARKKRNVTKMESSYTRQYDAYTERQRKKQKRLFRRLILFAAFAVVLLGLMTGYHIHQRGVYAQKQTEYKEKQEELASLQDKEKDLKEEIELLNDKSYVLEIARTNYFYSKDGETIFKITEEEPSY